MHPLILLLQLLVMKNAVQFVVLVHKSLFFKNNFCLLVAPSQPPVKVMWNTSNSKIILNWEQVKALENESEVMGYKVSHLLAI